MSGDIGPGTLVVCVDASDTEHILYGKLACPLVVGRAYRVTGVEECPWQPGHFGLLIAEHDPHPFKVWRADRFRKLNDGEDDAELIAKIKSCSPNRVPVTAATSPNAAEGRDSPLVPALTYLNGDEE